MQRRAGADREEPLEGPVGHRGGHAEPEGEEDPREDQDLRDRVGDDEEGAHDILEVAGRADDEAHPDAEVNPIQVFWVSFILAVRPTAYFFQQARSALDGDASG